MKIQIQDSCSSDEESVAVPLTKTAMVCKLAQIPPEIWMTFPLACHHLQLIFNKMSFEIFILKMTIPGE
jgi:hypothetical protein